MLVENGGAAGVVRNLELSPDFPFYMLPASHQVIRAEMIRVNIALVLTRRAFVVILHLRVIDIVAIQPVAVGLELPHARDGMRSRAIVIGATGIGGDDRGVKIGRA